MKYVIPSYQRPQELKSKTLNYLCNQKIDAKDIFIIVRSDDKYLHEYLDCGTDINIVQTEIKGIGRTHNFITEYFDEDDFIVELDDDIIDVIDNERKSIDNFSEIMETMKEIMIKENINYGGFYQVDNPKFMSQNKQYTFDLRYMLGLMRIRRIKKDIILETNYAEDMENCIQYYIRDGKILKNNWIAGKTKNYATGGCNGDGRNFETEKTDKEFLFNKYPKYCRLFQRKNGRWDLRLKHYK